jgi:hypothetical protein
LALLEREVLHQQDVEDLIGKRPYEEKKIFADEVAVVETKPEKPEADSATPDQMEVKSPE